MDLVVEVLSWVFLLAGSFFCLVGGLGLLRLPDFYTRVHAGGVTDTLGAGLMLTGLMFQAGLSLITVKLILILMFLAYSSATTAHALVKAAIAQGLKPLLDGDDAADVTDPDHATERGAEPSKP